MRVIPEISIMNGHCVKPLKGSFQYSEIISHSPRKVAKMWEEHGASYIHIRDLDGILAGHIMNQEVIRKLIQQVSIPVEIHGGISSLKEVENAINLGARKVVLELNNGKMNFIKEAVNCFGADKIVVTIQNGQGAANSHSVEKISIGELEETVKRLDEIGVRTLECEDLLGDVYTFATNLEYLSGIVKKSRLKVVVSGAIGTIKDLESVHNAGLNGVILDDVLYERKIDLKYAMELFDRGAGQDE